MTPTLQLHVCGENKKRGKKLLEIRLKTLMNCGELSGLVDLSPSLSNSHVFLGEARYLVIQRSPQSVCYLSFET